MIEIKRGEVTFVEGFPASGQTRLVMAHCVVLPILQRREAVCYHSVTVSKPILLEAFKSYYSYYRFNKTVADLTDDEFGEVLKEMDDYWRFKVPYHRGNIFELIKDNADIFSVFVFDHLQGIHGKWYPGHKDTILQLEQLAKELNVAIVVLLKGSKIKPYPLVNYYALERPCENIIILNDHNLGLRTSLRANFHVGRFKKIYEEALKR